MYVYVCTVSFSSTTRNSLFACLYIEFCMCRPTTPSTPWCCLCGTETIFLPEVLSLQSRMYIRLICNRKFCVRIVWPPKKSKLCVILHVCQEGWLLHSEANVAKFIIWLRYMSLYVCVYVFLWRSIPHCLLLHRCMHVCQLSNRLRCWWRRGP